MKLYNLAAESDKEGKRNRGAPWEGYLSVLALLTYSDASCDFHSH